MVAPGAVHLPGGSTPTGQRALADVLPPVGARGRRAPRPPACPTGGVMSVQITCLGWHWYPYRYSRTVDDGDGRQVAAFPAVAGRPRRRAVADAAAVDAVRVAGDGPTGRGEVDYRPDVALVNWYGPGARMGMHADRDERSAAPVVSLSVGDSCVFRFGTAGRTGPPVDRCDPRVRRPVRLRRAVAAGLPRRAQGAARHRRPGIGRRTGAVQRDPPPVRSWPDSARPALILSLRRIPGAISLARQMPMSGGRVAGELRCSSDP